MPRDPHCVNCSLKGGINPAVKTPCLWGTTRQLRAAGATIEVLVLGEAPGYQEDLRGEPFVGRSGDLLDEAFATLKFTDPYYVTNVGKCFPGAGKFPRDTAKGCHDYLEEELTTQRPRFILALGNTAIQRLVGYGKITELAGKEIWSPKYNCWIVPAFHPAYILRNLGGHAGWLADLKHFVDLVHGTLPPKIDVTVVEVNNLTKLDELAALLMKAGRFSFDFEATPIPWWDTDWQPYCISFSVNGTHSYVVPLEHPGWGEEHPYNLSAEDWMQTVREWVERHREALFQNSAIGKVAHNRLYDTLAWWRTFGYQITTTDCSMIAVQILNEHEPKALKWQGRTKLGWPDWDIDSTVLHPWLETREYNGIDSAATWLLMAEHYAPALREQGLYDYYRTLCMQDAAWIERMLWRGMPVDLTTLETNLGVAEIDSLLARASLPLKNPGSSQQVAKWLYEELGLPILKETPGGAPSTDESTINRLALLGHPEPKQVLAYRGSEKNIHTYYEPVRKFVERSFDGRLHPDIRMAAVETGRHSSFMHTIPRDATVRSMVASRDPAWELAGVDFAQLEARLSAWAAAGKPADWTQVDFSRAHMLEAFHDGRDLYKEMAGRALHKDPLLVTAKERQELGKVPVLAMLYKISWKGLREYAWKALQLDWSEAFARHIWATFNQLFPEFLRWHHEEAEKILARGWTRTAIGRMRRLPEVYSPDEQIREAAIRSGINMPIQGLGSDILQTAGILLDAHLDPLEAHIVHEIHDELLFLIRRDVLPRLIAEIKRYMNQAHYALRSLGLYLPDGLLTTEEKIGPWGKGVSLRDYLTAGATI